MASTSFYRKKDLTAEAFFARFRKSIPFHFFDAQRKKAQSHTPSLGAISIYFLNDEDVPDYQIGPRGSEEIARIVGGEETGWQAITIENHGVDADVLALRDRAFKLLTDKFGAVSQYDFELPPEDETEGGVDWDNLPPEVLAFDPIDLGRAWLLYNSTPEEREEAMRGAEENERKRQELWAVIDALLERREARMRRELLHPRSRRKKPPRRM